MALAGEALTPYQDFLEPEISKVEIEKKFRVSLETLKKECLALHRDVSNNAKTDENYFEARVYCGCDPDAFAKLPETIRKLNPFAVFPNPKGVTIELVRYGPSNGEGLEVYLDGKEPKRSDPGWSGRRKLTDGVFYWCYFPGMTYAERWAELKIDTLAKCKDDKDLSQSVEALFNDPSATTVEHFLKAAKIRKDEFLPLFREMLQLSDPCRKIAALTGLEALIDKHSIHSIGQDLVGTYRTYDLNKDHLTQRSLTSEELSRMSKIAGHDWDPETDKRISLEIDSDRQKAVHVAKTAAKTLATLTGNDWGEDYKTAYTWWIQHQKDPEFQPKPDKK